MNTTSQNESKRRRQWLTYLAVVLVLVFVVYPLSAGPAIVIVNHSANEKVHNILGVIYAPLNIVAGSTPQTQQLLDAYLTWWVGLAS